MVDAWASTGQVTDITTATVTETQLVQAQASVEMFSNRIYADSDRIRPRDLYWLRLAVAYQAAWEAGQFDLNTRLDTTSAQQDGAVATLGDRAVILGPRAKQALQRCSWMRSRSVHIRSAFEAGSAYGRDPLVDSEGDEHLWRPMSGGGS
ncbi:hypothetical protein K378_01442 [Streptomyces sp. Amel2xB2]|uniref:hypothetical protein n=1 Tax=Streptomyces sp. Amel2xB2 TaxID=1305829 RepID=UPI000DBA4F14|nr:hypothetical protein [Streptomyces sp. Amel2xB2]RAJ70277.1 hypothetical protein K378_01442 [Streptomyces sp. Amel2xB2]